MNLKALQQFTDELFGERQMTTKQFVKQWGFCPHQNGELCHDCLSDPSQRSYSWGDMADLTHETQVAIFNWCVCEDNEGNDNPYSDCPTQGNEQ